MNIKKRNRIKHGRRFKAYMNLGWLRKMAYREKHSLVVRGFIQSGKYFETLGEPYILLDWFRVSDIFISSTVKMSRVKMKRNGCRYVGAGD